MTERTFLRSLWVVCFFAITTILGGSVYLRWRIDRLSARMQAMEREIHEESVRLQAEHARHLEAFGGKKAIPTPHPHPSEKAE